MKQAAANPALDLLHKIETIEKEVKDLKLSVIKKLTPSGNKIISLKGIIKGVDVTDDDVIAAKKSLYSKVGI